MSPGTLPTSPSRQKREKRGWEPVTKPAAEPLTEKAASGKRVSFPVRQFIAEPAQQAPTVVTDAPATKAKRARKARVVVGGNFRGKS